MSTESTERATLSLRQHVAAEARAEAARQRISARRLALALGESHTWVNRRLTGAIAMTTDDMERLAALLRVPLSVFVGSYAGLTSPPPPPPAAGGSSADNTPDNDEASIHYLAHYPSKWARSSDLGHSFANGSITDLKSA